MADMLPKIMDIAMKILGPLLVLFAWALFAAMFYIYFAHILPLRQIHPLDADGVVYTTVGLWIIVNLFYNHTMAVIVSPLVSSKMHIPPNIHELIAEELPLLRRGEVFGKYCRICIAPKPERAHHCHICNRCVLKMDHHCPWVANCVGQANYKFFFLFLFYLWIGCAFIGSLCLPAIIWKPINYRQHENGVFFAFVLCLSAFIALGGMLGLHLYLTLTNQSTIELYNNRKLKNNAGKRGETWVNKFDLGVRKNFQQVFGVGRYWFSWMLPGHPDIGDGVHWATIHADDVEREHV